VTAASTTRALGPFCYAYFVSYLLRTMNAVIAPELAAELNIGPGGLGLLTSAYFFAFAVAQLPVGLALDRWGARRIVAGLMVPGAVGAGVFAVGKGFVVLMVGRAMMGLGVAACLMGALKVAHDRFPASRQTSLTALVMSIGYLGALAATSPVRAALPVVGWRGALWAAAALCLAAAVTVWLVAPADPTPPAADRDRALAGLAAVVRARPFWRFAPQAALFTGGFMALQGLWIVPWAMSVDGHSGTEAATRLLLFTLSMLCGQLVIGLGAPAAERAGVDRLRLMTASLALGLLALGLAVAGLASGALPWCLLGFFGAASAQVYGVTASRFPTHLSGRVSTALNLLAFSGAFVLQWGIGVAIELLAPRTGTVAAFRITFGALWVLQAAALAASLTRAVHPSEIAR
jgi:predicted MFS family arabinose efflux permease